jgi:hypothetical protein
MPRPLSDRHAAQIGGFAVNRLPRPAEVLLLKNYYSRASKGANRRYLVAHSGGQRLASFSSAKTEEVPAKD